MLAGPVRLQSKQNETEQGRYLGEVIKGKIEIIGEFY